jgi:hypothetical protein
MTKDELIDEYLLAREFHSEALGNRRFFIRENEFLYAMFEQLKAYYWRDRVWELSDELIAKGWYEDALKEICL